MESTLGVKYDVILTLRSQIFEYLRGTVLRIWLRVPAIGYIAGTRCQVVRRNNLLGGGSRSPRAVAWLRRVFRRSNFYNEPARPGRLASLDQSQE